MKTMFIVLLAALAVLPTLTLAFAPAPFYRTPKVSRVDVGKNVALEIRGDRVQTRRVVLNATVCLREGHLEHLLTRKGTKEYEAVLAADADARDIHTALLLAGAVPGKPFQFGPRFVPPTGHGIQITLEWREKGRPRRGDARQWVREIKSKKALPHNWVFVGSQLFRDPQQAGRPYYLANQGDVICVANFDGAMLDLPVHSSSSGAALLYEAFTENIPPRDTEVTVYLDLIGGKK